MDSTKTSGNMYKVEEKVEKPKEEHIDQEDQEDQEVDEPESDEEARPPCPSSGEAGKTKGKEDSGEALSMLAKFAKTGKGRKGLQDQLCAFGKSCKKDGCNRIHIPKDSIPPKICPYLGKCHWLNCQKMHVFNRRCGVKDHNVTVTPDGRRLDDGNHVRNKRCGNSSCQPCNVATPTICGQQNPLADREDCNHGGQCTKPSCTYYHGPTNCFVRGCICSANGLPGMNIEQMIRQAFVDGIRTGMAQNSSQMSAAQMPAAQTPGTSARMPAQMPVRMPAGMSVQMLAQIPAQMPVRMPVLAQMPAGNPKKPCRFGDQCRNSNCIFAHPPGWNPNSIQQCREGNNCSRADCKFAHPEGWTPAPKVCKWGLNCHGLKNGNCPFLHLQH